MGLLPLVPESPRWLLMNDRTEEGLEAIRRFLGKGLLVEDPIVQSEYRSIKGAILIEKESQTSISNVLARRDRSGHLKRLLLGCGGQFMQASISDIFVAKYWTDFSSSNSAELTLSITTSPSFLQRTSAWTSFWQESSLGAMLPHT